MKLRINSLLSLNTMNTLENDEELKHKTNFTNNFTGKIHVKNELWDTREPPLFQRASAGTTRLSPETTQTITTDLLTFSLAFRH